MSTPCKHTVTTLSKLELLHRLGYAFQQRGYELYLVGGAVRDALLGLQTTDLDFATDAPPEVSLTVLESLPHDAVYRVGEKFGTIGMVVGPYRIEVTTYRTDETYRAGSRKPKVRFGRTLTDDLKRRDFTINAMAQAVLDGSLIDPYGGQADLRARLIRAVGDPMQRFVEDPLRLLRAVRFAAQLDFVIEPSTWEAMRTTAPLLRQVSRERIADEYARMLTGPRPALALTLLRDAGLLETTVPELMALTLMPDHGPHHPLSLWDHTMRVVSGVPPDLIVRWAAVLHDIAKPQTRTVESNGRVRFFNHDVIGAQIAHAVMTSLHVSREVVDAVTLLVETHMQPHAYSPEWSDGAVRRLVQRLGPHFERALQLARADAAAHSLDGTVRNTAKLDQLEQRARALALPFEVIKSPLNGDELMARYQRPPGPWIRVVKDALTEQVLEGRLVPNDKEEAWHIADRIVSQLEA
jgi:poly(A) polymerase